MQNKGDVLMTCIIGYVEGEKVFMGSDSCVSSGWTEAILNNDEGKVFKKGDIVFGITGLLRYMQLIRHDLTIRQKGTEETDIEYLTTGVMKGILNCFKNNNAITIKDNKTRANWGALLGYNKKLYTIGGAFSIISTDKNYLAHGCGMQFALGSLHSLEKYKLSPKERITKALEAASEYSAGVSPPFNIVEL